MILKTGCFDDSLQSGIMRDFSLVQERKACSSITGTDLNDFKEKSEVVIGILKKYGR